MPDSLNSDYIPRSCSKQHPCNRFYHCDMCARRRQARFADVAERIEAAFGVLDYAVVTPDDNTQAAIERAKTAILRASDSPALIWSVEVGLIAGRLHLNLLGPNLDDIKVKNADVHVEPTRTGARAVAAYMTKRAGFPSRQHYPGRIVGTAGNVMQFLGQAGSIPVVQAGALLKIIETARFNRVGANLTGEEISTDLKKLVAYYVADLTRLATLTRRPRA